MRKIFIIFVFVGVLSLVIIATMFSDSLQTKAIIIGRKLLHKFHCKNQQSSSRRIHWNYFYYYENEDNGKTLLWCKIPKSGSTTVTRLLLKLAGAEDVLKRDRRIHWILRKYYPRAKILNSNEPLVTSYKFIVVRHPFIRILSAYRDKLEDLQRDLYFRDGYYYNQYGRFMKGVGGNGANSSSRIEPTWKEFVSYLIETPVARFDQHWTPMTTLCSPCAVHYDFIIKLEHLAPDLSKLLEKIGISISAEEIGHSHRTNSSSAGVIGKYFQELSLLEMKLLYKKYKQDFDLFGYSPFKFYQFAKQ